MGYFVCKSPLLLCVSRWFNRYCSRSPARMRTVPPPKRTHGSSLCMSRYICVRLTLRIRATSAGFRSLSAGFWVSNMRLPYLIHRFLISKVQFFGFCNYQESHCVRIWSPQFPGNLADQFALEIRNDKCETTYPWHKSTPTSYHDSLMINYWEIASNWDY